MSNFAGAWRGELPGFALDPRQVAAVAWHAGSPTCSGHFGASSGGPAALQRGSSGTPAWAPRRCREAPLKPAYRGDGRALGWP